MEWRIRPDLHLAPDPKPNPFLIFKILILWCSVFNICFDAPKAGIWKGKHQYMAKEAVQHSVYNCDGKWQTSEISWESHYSQDLHPVSAWPEVHLLLDVVVTTMAMVSFQTHSTLMKSESVATKVQRSEEVTGSRPGFYSCFCQWLTVWPKGKSLPLAEPQCCYFKMLRFQICK